MSERIHSFQPVCNEECRILILGTAPSVRSLEQGFYYMHPQNKFWKVMGRVLRCDLSGPIEEKKARLLLHGVALWDIIESCERQGSLDAAIRNPLPNDIPRLLNGTKIRAVFCNGATSHRLTLKFFPACHPVRLPSTSPANNGNFREQDWMNLRNFLE